MLSENQCITDFCLFPGKCGRALLFPGIFPSDRGGHRRSDREYKVAACNIPKSRGKYKEKK